LCSINSFRDTVSSCKSLEKLSIAKFQGLTGRMLSSFNELTLPNLETLIISRMQTINDLLVPIGQDELKLKPLESFIRNTNRNLKVLRLGRNFICNRKTPEHWIIPVFFPPQGFMNAISLSCRNLTLFEVHIRKEISPKVIELLSLNTQLNRMIFSVELDLIDDKNFWKELSKNLPVSLKDLTIIIGPIFWLIVIHWLFDGMKSELESLQFPISSFIDDEYLSIIAQYAKIMGSLKKFGVYRKNRITKKGYKYARRFIKEITSFGEYDDF
jgi:hypothetical protein